MAAGGGSNDNPAAVRRCGRARRYRAGLRLRASAFSKDRHSRSHSACQIDTGSEPRGATRRAGISRECGHAAGISFRLGAVDRFAKLARELIDVNCDLIFAIGPHHSARAMRDARSPVPVVILAIDYDPVEKGIIASLRRPEANMTGVYLPTAALAVKRLDIY